LLNYDKYTDFEIGELRAELEGFDEDDLECDDFAEGIQVLIAFFEEEEINEVRIYG
jgi:hypothetical protein